MLTKLTIEVPDLGDNRKNLSVEGAIAVGEKVSVTLVGIPDGTPTDGGQLRLRVLGPIGENLARHGDWTVGDDGEYTTDLDLASVQAYRLFVPPPPPRLPPPPVPVPPPRFVPTGYVPGHFPPAAPSVPVRLLVELRETAGSDSDADSDELDMSMLGMAERPLFYWPTDWRTATLVDLADGRVYSKEEVDALLALQSESISAMRAKLDGIEDGAQANRIEVVKRNGTAVPIVNKTVNINVPQIAAPSTNVVYRGIAADAYQTGVMLAGKASLVDGKVPSDQLPSYVDDVVEYPASSDFPRPGESGKIYIAKDTNKSYRWTGDGYAQIGGGEIPVPIAPSTDPSAAGKPADAKATGDALALKMDATADGDTILTGGTSWTEAPIGVFADQITNAVNAKLNSFAIAPGFDPAQTYHIGEYCSYNCNIYVCTRESSGDFSYTNWALVTVMSQIPAAQIQGDWNQSDSTAKDFIKNKPTIPAAQVQANWNETNTSSKAYIQNKPTIPTVPTNVSAFTNDAGYLTSAPVTSVNGDTGAVNIYGSTLLMSSVDSTSVSAAIAAAQGDATQALNELPYKLDASKRNLLDYTTGTTLDPATSVYKSTLNSDGTFPTITDMAIATANSYFQFELELTVPSTVPSTITGPTGWTWLAGHELPDPSDLLGGETIYISVRLDCTARTFLASVWRVA